MNLRAILAILLCKCLRGISRLLHRGGTAMPGRYALKLCPNLLELLADEFTREEYRQMRQAQGRSGSGDATLRSWVKRGHIVFDEVSGRYCKTHTVAALQRCSS